MPMNKKLHKRICLLHQEGLSTAMTIKLFIVLAKNPDDAAEAIQEFLELNYKAWNDLVEERKPTHLSVEPCAHCGVKEGEFHKKGCIFLKGGTDDSTI